MNEAKYRKKDTLSVGGYFGCFLPIQAFVVLLMVLLIWTGVVQPMEASVGFGHFEPSISRDSKGNSHESGDYVDHTGYSWPISVGFYCLVLGGLVFSQWGDFVRKQDQDLPAGFVNLRECPHELWAEAAADPEVLGLLVDGQSSREKKLLKNAGSGLGCLGTMFSAALLPAAMARSHDPNLSIFALALTGILALSWLRMGWQLRRRLGVQDWVCIEFIPPKMRWVNRRPGQASWQEGAPIEAAGLKVVRADQLIHLTVAEEKGPFELLTTRIDSGASQLQDFAQALAGRLRLDLL